MIGDHELDTVPKSLMTSDGVLHPGHNKDNLKTICTFSDEIIVHDITKFNQG